MLTDCLVVGEEKELALDDRAADTAAKLVVVKGTLSYFRIFKKIPGVEVLIAIVFVRRSVELIGAGLANLNYDQPPGFAVFCRHAVLLNSELLDRLNSRLHVLPAKHWRSDRGAVQDIVVCARTAAADAYVAVISARAESTTAGPRTRAPSLLAHARCQYQEVIRPPA